MKATNNTLEITNGVEFRVILSIEGKKNQTTIFTTRKSAKAAIREMERDLMATNTGCVIRLICNVYEDGELVTNSELGRCQFDPSKVITVKVEPTTDTPANESEADETLDRLKSELQEYHNNASKGGADRERNMQWLQEDIRKLEQKKAEKAVISLPRYYTETPERLRFLARSMANQYRDLNDPEAKRMKALYLDIAGAPGYFLKNNLIKAI